MKTCFWVINTSLVIFASIYLSIYLKFPQLNIKKIFKSIKNSKDSSTLSSVMMSLAGKIGVGSIAGVALSIHLGGSGSIFWMIIFSLFLSILSYSETVLGNIYKENQKNEFYGGPNYYIKNGLNNKILSNIYSLLIILSYVIGFISIQSNTIVKSIKILYNIPELLVGFLIAFIVYIIIYKETSRIFKIVNKLVPLMIFFYIYFCLIILINNINMIIPILKTIIRNAFNFDSIRYGFLSSVIIGIQRSIFATESGMGTGSIATSTVDDKKNNLPYLQVVGVYIISFIICGLTSFVILSSKYETNINAVNGIEIIENSFNYHLGDIGNYVVIISIFFFALSTIITCYYYGMSAFYYLFNRNNNFIKKISIIIVIIGSIISAKLLWEIIDVLVACLSIINIYSILKLKGNIYYLRK